MPTSGNFGSNSRLLFYLGPDTVIQEREGSVECTSNLQHSLWQQSKAQLIHILMVGVFLQDHKAVVIDHQNFARVTGISDADHTLIAASDFVNSSIILGPTGIEVGGTLMEDSRQRHLWYC